MTDFIEDQLLNRIDPGSTVPITQIHEAAKAAGIAKQQRKTFGILSRAVMRGKAQFSHDKLHITRPLPQKRTSGKKQGSAKASADTEQPQKSRVAQAYSNSGQSIAKAAEMLFEAVRQDEQFIALHLDNILKVWCHDEVRRYVSGLRKRVITVRAAAHPKRNRAERQRLSEKATLLDFVLPNSGKRLADATGTQVAAAASYYLQSAADASLKGNWLARVAERAKKKRVGDVLGEEQLQALMTEARGE